MKSYLFQFLFTLLIITNVYGDTLSNDSAAKFIISLLKSRSQINNFILPEELNISGRLGIEYSGVDNKCLISNDIAPSLREELNNKKITFTYKVIKLNNDYSKLIFSIPSLDITKEYYFKDSYLISPPYYFAKNWKKEESKYFIFHISAPSLFNHYAEKKLDNFVDKISKVLKFSNDQVKKLKKNKIHYYLCKDGNEIKRLTGYDARGLYYLPYDYIISTFNCHYHEILHLLMNYKLGKPSLYTLPFLQEGFAVAFGGRGGKEPDVILQMGAFLSNNNFLNYNTLLNKESFNQYDATMTYPVSGLYNKFLINELGINKYIALYKKYSGDAKDVEKFRIIPDDLPPAEKWRRYLKNYLNNNSIKVEIPATNEIKEMKKGKNNYVISEDTDYYLFQIRDTLLLSPSSNKDNHQSKLFQELFPEKTYLGEKYAVIADSNEVSIYNFYSNNLIAKYVRSFSILNKKVPQINNYYQFLIKKNLFDKPLKELIFN